MYVKLKNRTFFCKDLGSGIKDASKFKKKHLGIFRISHRNLLICSKSHIYEKNLDQISVNTTMAETPQMDA